MVINQTNLWSRLNDWGHEHALNGSLLAVLILGAAAGLGFCSYLYWPQPPQPIQPVVQQEVVTEKGATKYYSPLTGVEVSKASTAKRPVTAIMIENSYDARPQSGIKSAGIVYEAIAEGGITRFLTLHQEDRPGMIGPVRSLRPYYIDWLAPFNASVAHAGGSLKAIREIRNGSYRDIDEFANGSYYWRATDRYAPHNLYTSFDRLDKLNKMKGYTSSKFTPWPRKLDSPIDGKSAASRINIDVSGALFAVRYDYKKATNSYLRSIGGVPHNDREAGRLAPKVVIALKVPTYIGMEDGPREQMRTIGYGDAYIFQDGVVIKAIWRKSGKKAQMEFFDKFGRVVALNAGQTWLTVVAPSKSVTWR